MKAASVAGGGVGRAAAPVHDLLLLLLLFTYLSPVCDLACDTVFALCKKCRRKAAAVAAATGLGGRCGMGPSRRGFAISLGFLVSGLGNRVQVLKFGA